MTTMTSNVIKPERRLQVLALSGLSQKYGPTVPVAISVEQNGMMRGWYTITVSVPGQLRRVNVTAMQMDRLGNTEVANGIMEEVLFAAFLLLDEEDLEND